MVETRTFQQTLDVKIKWIKEEKDDNDFDDDNFTLENNNDW